MQNSKCKMHNELYRYTTAPIVIPSQSADWRGKLRIYLLFLDCHLNFGMIAPGNHAV